MKKLLITFLSIAFLTTYTQQPSNPSDELLTEIFDTAKTTNGERLEQLFENVENADLKDPRTGSHLLVESNPKFVELMLKTKPSWPREQIATIFQERLLNFICTKATPQLNSLINRREFHALTAISKHLSCNDVNELIAQELTRIKNNIESTNALYPAEQVKVKEQTQWLLNIFDVIKKNTGCSALENEKKNFLSTLNTMFPVFTKPRKNRE